MSDIVDNKVHIKVEKITSMQTVFDYDFHINNMYIFIKIRINKKLIYRILL